MALSNSKTPFTAIPKSLNGNSISQIIGYKINTAMAKGAQSTNNNSQSKNVVILYFFDDFTKINKNLIKNSKEWTNRLVSGLA